MITQISASFAPPILSAKWPKNMRAATKAIANAVKPLQASQPRVTKSSPTNAVIAPKPTLLSAAPHPGSHTAARTLVNAGWTRAAGAARLSGATTSRVRSGSTIVPSAIAPKPYRAYSSDPTGAPSAKAAYIALPIHERTRPVFWDPASTKPQLCAPVMMKLSPAPSSARPSSRIVTEVAGSLTKRSDNR